MKTKRGDDFNPYGNISASEKRFLCRCYSSFI